MIEILKKVIANLLTVIYQPFGCAVIFAILLMFLYILLREYGWKETVKKWVCLFKTDKLFQKLFFLAFYIAMILLSTLLNRSMWTNPVQNVIGVWGLYTSNGAFTTDAVENFILFIPFVILLFWAYEEKLANQTVKILTTLWWSIAITFLFSLSIELLQLFLRLGTFQLSDLFFNTLGGFVGGFIYWILYKIRFRKK